MQNYYMTINGKSQMLLPDFFFGGEGELYTGWDVHICVHNHHVCCEITPIYVKAFKTQYAPP